MAQIITFLKIIQDGILPQHKSEPILSTNLLFRLHTKYASTAFLIAATLLFIQQLFIEHFKCFRPLELGTAMESQPLNQFCYTQGSYASRNETYSDPGKVRGVTYLHNYFQWIPFILLLQGLAFHIPQLIWSKWVERGRLACYCAISPATTGDNAPPPPLPTPQENKPEESVRMIEAGTQTVHGPSHANAFPFALSVRTTSNQKYFRGWVTCEVLNLLILILLAFVNEWFLGGRFFSLGPDWIAYVHKLRGVPQSREDVASYLHQVEMSNPLEGIFPTLFTCHWTKPGAGGATFEIACIFAQNATHQRVYLTFWITFLLLILMDLSNLLYRLILMRSTKARVWLVERQVVNRGVKSPVELGDILAKLPACDWFVMKRILQNVDPTKFDVIVHQVSGALKQQQRLHGAPSLKNGVDIELQPISAIDT